MNLDADKLAVHKGDYKPKSVTIFLIGPKIVDLDWALGAFTLRIPLFVNYKARTAETEEEAIKKWQEDSQTGYILLWPNGQTLSWSALADGLAENADRVDFGQAKLLKRNGNWEVPVLHTDLTDSLGVHESLELLPGTNPAKSVVVCLPSLGRVPLVWAANVMCMEGPIGYIQHLSVVTDYPVDEAREELVDRVMAMNPRPAYILFFGDDMLPPTNVIHALFHILDNLVDIEVPAVSGLYHVKHYPKQAVAWRKDGVIVEGKDFKQGDLVEVDGCGLDFCLIKTKYLENVPKPRFKVVETDTHVATEDVWFWHRFHQATGLRPYVMTNCVVGHYDSKTDFIY